MTDRLAEIEQQVTEFGGGGEGTNIRWLIEEVKRLRRDIDVWGRIWNDETIMSARAEHLRNGTAQLA